ncbi:hypothetical protein SDJN03_23099, partial [Cucurbita argyrosperma subsp. sororia]
MMQLEMLQRARARALSLNLHRLSLLGLQPENPLRFTSFCASSTFVFDWSSFLSFSRLTLEIFQWSWKLCWLFAG